MLIHQLAHVWQGQHGLRPPLSMAQAAWAQFSGGVRDVWPSGRWRGWDKHRGAAYLFNRSDIGRNWSPFNTEQQAALVQSWFMPENARFLRVAPIGGSDPAIRAMQETLAALGYLDPRYVDGVVGRSRSATLDAVAAFQRRNGLAPDRELGGPHSLTRAKLAQPLGTLARAS